jgi:hypothetical protein
VSASKIHDSNHAGNLNGQDWFLRIRLTVTRLFGWGRKQTREHDEATAAIRRLGKGLWRVDWQELVFTDFEFSGFEPGV